MPLPPALAARLAKRGILQKSGSRRDNEEVIAENYDDKSERRGFSKDFKIDDEKLEEVKLMGHNGCPNKYNVFHECQSYCINRWGEGKTTPDPGYVVLHEKMMKKYGPLPEDWKEYYDPGSGRHYFWCTRTNRVSWFPPGHPKAKIIEAASKIREIIQIQSKLTEEADKEQLEKKKSDDEDSHASESSQDEDGEEEEDDDEDKEIEERHHQEKEMRKAEQEKYRKRARFDDEKVDPMDPSAYSDAPRGSWSSGLDNTNNEA